MRHSGLRAPVLDVAGLSVRFGPSTVLAGVDLSLCRGEVVAVLGVSGSGKSTLLRCLLGLVPEPGRIGADRLVLHGPEGGVDLLDLRPAGWRNVRGELVGMVFQDAGEALSPLRRVASLLAEAAGDRADHDPLEHLAACGFGDPGAVMGRRACELSGGMAQRVGMALATARRPRLLLADEPTTALDGPARAELVTWLRSLADQGSAVLITSHDVSVAAGLADRVVVLEGGAVVEEGPAARVLATPAHPSTQRLVERVPWREIRMDPRVAPGAIAALEIEGLTKAFAAPVLRGVDLRLGPGEVVGVAGMSGAGKSTLVRCVMGLEHPDAGTVRAGGADPALDGWKAMRRRVQLVAQDPRASLNPWRTAVQSVGDPMRYHRIGTRLDRRVRALGLLEAVGLAGLEDRYPATLSTGQCQRVAIARALAIRPAVVVADEPVSALDTPNQAEIMALLRAVVDQEGAAALVVSHDLHVLERLCDRIAVLDGGRIVADLPVQELRVVAAHPTTAALLACYPPDPLDHVRSTA